MPCITTCAWGEDICTTTRCRGVFGDQGARDSPCLSKPPRPQPVHESVRDGGCRQAAVFPPRPAIENSGDGRNQSVVPVEVPAGWVSLVEMRQAKQHGSDYQRPW